MTADDGQTLLSDSSNQAFEPFVFFCPLLNLSRQIGGHIYGSVFPCLLKGQLPGGRLASRSPHLAEGSFHKHADISELLPIGIPEPMVPARAGGFCFHVAKCINLAIKSNKIIVSKNLFLLTIEKAPEVRAPAFADAPNSARRNHDLEPLVAEIAQNLRDESV